MRAPRDVLALAALLAVILLAALSRSERADVPSAPPPTSKEEGRVLRAPTRFSPAPVVRVSGDPLGPQTGTAFSVNAAGVWVTARHVVQGCRRLAVLLGGGQAAQARLAPGPDPPVSDVAVLRTEGGAPALPLAGPAGLRIGERGFHPGFPGGAPGEATTRLLGRQTLETRVRGRAGQGGSRREAVLSFAEAGRSGGPGARIAGLSGAPVLDARGEVVGVTLAAAPRRGRLYAASLEEIRAALQAAGAPIRPTGAVRISVATYARRSEELRRALTVAQIVCLDR